MRTTITVIGTGYVGLVSGACFAELGHDVICVDKDADKIALLQAGSIPIFEPGLAEIVRANVLAGRLRFSLDVAGSVQDRQAVFIAVGTPMQAQSDKADLSYVYAAAAEIARSVSGFTVVVSKSTVPVGTNARVQEICGEHVSPGAQIAVVSNPEFLREGAAISDFMQPDRVIIGVEDPRAAEVMRQIYAPLVKNRGVPVVETDLATAELIKYAANAFLAVKISFINEMSDLCEKLGAQVTDVSRGLGLDRRIGAAFLAPGPAWGGSCFPKDTRALLASAADLAMPCQVVEAAVAANEARKRDMLARIRAACGGEVRGKRIGVLGLTFKGQTDDMRESISLSVLPALVAEGADVRAFDPAASRAEVARLLPGVAHLAEALAVAEQADLLVVLTDWMIFKTYRLTDFAARMQRAHLVDLRNLYDAADAVQSGFVRYEGLGAAPIEV